MKLKKRLKDFDASDLTPPDIVQIDKWEGRFQEFKTLVGENINYLNNTGIKISYDYNEYDQRWIVTVNSDSSFSLRASVLADSLRKSDDKRSGIDAPSVKVSRSDSFSIETPIDEIIERVNEIAVQVQNEFYLFIKAYVSANKN